MENVKTVCNVLDKEHPCPDSIKKISHQGSLGLVGLRPVRHGSKECGGGEGNVIMPDC